MDHVYISGYARSQDYVGTPQKTPHRSTHSTEKETATLLREFCAGCELFEVISDPQRTLCKRVEVFKWDVWICVGSLRRLRGPYVIPRAGGAAYPVICLFIFTMKLKLKLKPKDQFDYYRQQKVYFQTCDLWLAYFLHYKCICAFVALTL